MIGMSLSYQNLVSVEEPALKPETLFPKLWNHGVRSVEIRGISTKACPLEAFRVINLLWDYGFNVTVHSTVKSVQTAVTDVFVPLTHILLNMRQRELILTIHPIAGDNAAMLKALSDHIIEHNYPVCIALENNRRMPDGTDGDSVALVLDAVRSVNRKNVGICFDMGHFAWYTANFTDTPDMLPPKEFLSRVIHTHIHAYTEGSTHFPLDEWREPFSLYINALDFRYVGVYNVELEPKRFTHRWDATEAYLISADTLRQNYPSRAEYHDELRLHYDGYFRRSLEVLNKKDGCYGSLIASSSYLFSTNGYKWAMDVSFITLNRLAGTPSRVREYLGDLDCMMLTHAHTDHMDERTIRLLADTEISWVVPDFLVDDMIKFGVHRERITAVKAGDDVCVGPLRIHVLKGRHFRPGTRSGIDAVGYLISADNAPTLAFPGDVRDYSVKDGEELNADHCFAHIWLTDCALESEKYIPKSREFAEFMLSQSRKSILLAHLNVNREDSKRWTVHHALVARDAILEKSPETVVRTLRYGEIFKL